MHYSHMLFKTETTNHGKIIELVEKVNNITTLKYCFDILTRIVNNCDIFMIIPEFTSKFYQVVVEQI